MAAESEADRIDKQPAPLAGTLIRYSLGLELDFLDIAFVRLRTSCWGSSRIY